MTDTQDSRLSTQDLVDTHAHLDSYSDVEAVIARAEEAGVSKIVVAAFSFPCSEFNIRIANKHGHIFAAVGVHPHSASELDEFAKQELAEMARDSKVKAIGETGLDYHYLYSEKEQQVQAFKWHIQLANELDLPLIIHSREALDESFEILEKEGWPKRFVFHAFSGDIKQAQKIFEAGGLVSVTGVVTFKNAKPLQELVQQIDLNKIMVETDSPYLSPEPFRGKANEPANVVKVAEKIAELQGISFERVAEVTTETAERFFRI